MFRVTREVLIIFQTLSGGSPPPEMTWLKNGEIASDDSIEFTPALDRDTPTVSVITVIPEKVSFKEGELCEKNAIFTKQN